MSNVKPGDLARDITDGQIVEVIIASNVVDSRHGFCWLCIAITPGVETAPDSSMRFWECGQHLYIADYYLRPLRAPDSQITTERETEVTV